MTPKLTIEVRRCLAALLLLGVILNLAGCAGRPGKSQMQERLPEVPFASDLQDALDRALLSGQRDHDLGISAAVIVPGYSIWLGVSGNSHAGVPITPDMVFNAGSITKSFESALALRLAEQGVLDLDDPISTWLPSYRNVDGTITVRQLLNHTSGVFNVFEHPAFPWVGPQVDYAKRWKLEDVFNSFVLEPYGPPGYAQHYSSTNYLLLTTIIERVSGTSVPVMVEGYFFRPLNLKHSFMSMGERLPEHLSAAHPWVDVDRDGDLDDLVSSPTTWIATLTHPLIFSVPEDLARWIHALYYDRNVLSASSLGEMLTYPESTVPDPEGAQYGLGVVNYSKHPGMQVFGHCGSSLGYSAAALYLPEYNTSVAWLFNTGESPWELANAIMSNTWKSLSGVLRMHIKPNRSRL